jgi:hypothetical protein
VKEILYCKGQEDMKLLHWSRTIKEEEQSVVGTPVKHVLTSLVALRAAMVVEEEEDR